MSVHVGELTSQVEVAGVPAAGRPAADGPGRSPGWAERQRFADLAEECELDRARTDGGGFDG